MLERNFILTILIITIIILSTTMMIVNIFEQKRPSIDDVWIINLDKDKERLEKLLEQQHQLPVPIKRWSASYGKEEDRFKITEEGVQEIISRSANAEENAKSRKVLSRAGEIGCWLSHKRLLTHLSLKNYGPDHGHLICEDDIIINKNFINEWNLVQKNIPTDWDIIYFGINDIHGTRINEGVLRWKNDVRISNMGTHSYMVRQKSIAKILDKLVLMGAPIDLQYYKMLGDLNIYILDPVLITTNSAFESSIDKQELRYV